MYKGGLYLALGDSVTWKVVTGLSKGADYYVTQIWRRINSQYGPVRLINKGLGSQNSNDLITNLAWATTMRPNLVTIGIGLNDCQNGNAVAVATYQNNLRTLIDRLRLRNPDVVIILCTQSRCTDATREPYADTYRTAMAAVATEKAVGICHFEDAWAAPDTATYVQDTVHPNAAGHALLYNLLRPVVQDQAAAWLATLG